ncbi:MAG TPA: Gfo/Idh/MocA family oxidoreductase [Methylomirabilota bacterium]|nr:Gfo/Idh/MocA family oxidoreductase [Methylomirabilota bacterium]
MGNPAHKTQLRFLVIGCGSIGKRHIKNLRALGVSDILAFDLRADRRGDVTSTLGICAVENLDAAWERRPHVVIVAAPTSLHVPLALKSASRQCHLFVEKPLSHDWEGVQRLLETVKQNRLVTLVGCNMRFHPGLTALNSLLADRTIGNVIAARVEVGHYLPDWHPWEDYRQSYSARRELGGGVILDAIHEIDYIRWLLGEVAGATCVAGKLSQLEIDTEDVAAILLRFENGVVGEIHLDYIQRAYRRTCQIIGEDGTLHWDYTAGEVRWFSAQTKQWKVYSNPDGWHPNQMYLDEMKHFLCCVAGEEESTLDVFDAAKVLRIALAAKEAARQQRWIELRSQTWNTNPIL